MHGIEMNGYLVHETRSGKRFKKNSKLNSLSDIKEDLIPVDDDCEIAALLIKMWASVYATTHEVKQESCVKRESRTANACKEHKSRHQKCPLDCVNRRRGRTFELKFEYLTNLKLRI